MDLMGNISICTFSLVGIALLYFHLGNYYLVDRNDTHLRREYYEKALDLIVTPLRHLKGRRVTFLCGDAGPLSLGAVLYERLGETKERDKCLKRYVGNVYSNFS